MLGKDEESVSDQMNDVLAQVSDYCLISPYSLQQFLMKKDFITSSNHHSGTKNDFIQSLPAATIRSSCTCSSHGTFQVGAILLFYAMP